MANNAAGRVHVADFANVKSIAGAPASNRSGQQAQRPHGEPWESTKGAQPIDPHCWEEKQLGAARSHSFPMFCTSLTCVSSVGILCKLCCPPALNLYL